METRAKLFAEFHSEIHEILSSQETRIDEIVAKHDTRFDQLIELITKNNNHFEQLVNDMQALRLQQNQPVSSHIRPHL